MARTILTDKEWETLKPFIPDCTGKKGHPPRNHRQVLEAILWVLRTGAPWRDVPKELCPWMTAYTRFRRWIIQGVWIQIWVHLKKTLIMKHTFWTQQLSKSIKTHVEPLENRLVNKQLVKQPEAGRVKSI